MTKSCKSCSKEFGIFRWRKECSCCQAIVCRDCICSVPKCDIAIDIFPDFGSSVCDACWSSKGKTPYLKYQECLDSKKEVELVSINYKGVKGRLNKNGIPITTGWFRDKGDCESCLQVTASFLGREIVTQVSIERGTGTESGDSPQGTHTYSKWRGTGLACTL